MIQKTINGFKITTEFGVIDSLHKTPHNGIDIALPEGSPLYSIGKAVVENVVNYGDNNIGKGVILKLDNGLRVIYGHLSEAKVKIGEQIEPGQLIALSGNSGRSTGPHLHLSLKEGQTPIDPSKYAEAALEKQIDNPWIPNFIEKPYKETTNSIAELNGKIDSFTEWITYWFNPKNLGIEIWDGLNILITSPDTAVFLLSGTIVGFWLIALGAKWPKKWLFWGWIVFWALRGFVFA